MSLLRTALIESKNNCSDLAKTISRNSNFESDKSQLAEVGCHVEDPESSAENSHSQSDGNISRGVPESDARTNLNYSKSSANVVESKLACLGCGYASNKTELLDRHKKRCVFNKRLDSTLSPKENDVPIMVPFQRHLRPDISAALNVKSLLKTSILMNVKKNPKAQSVKPVTKVTKENETAVTKETKQSETETSNETDTQTQTIQDCNKSQPSKTAVGKKRRTSARRRLYLCTKCSFSSMLSREYLEHLRDVHKKIVQIYQCDVCSYACKNRYKLLRHRNHVHQERSPRKLSDFKNLAGEIGSSPIAEGVRYGIRQTSNTSLCNETQSIARNISDERQNIFDKVYNLLLENSMQVATEPNSVSEVLDSMITSDCINYNDFDDGKQLSDVNSNVLDLTVKTTDVSQIATENTDPQLLDLTTTSTLNTEQSRFASSNTEDAVSEAHTDKQQQKQLSHFTELHIEIPSTDVAVDSSDTSLSIKQNRIPLLLSGSVKTGSSLDEDIEVEAITRAAERRKEVPLPRTQLRSQRAQLPSSCAQLPSPRAQLLSPRAQLASPRGRVSPQCHKLTEPLLTTRRQQLSEAREHTSSNFRNQYDVFNFTSGEESVCSPIKAMSNMGKYLDHAFNNVREPISHNNKATSRFHKQTTRKMKETITTIYGNVLSSDIETKPKVFENSTKQYGPDPGSTDETEEPGKVVSGGNCVDSTYNYIKAVVSHPGVGPQYGCRLCRYTSAQKWKVAHHVRQIHLRSSFYKCFHCDFVCKRKTEWTVHLVKHSSRKVHCCKECSYKTVMRRNFTRHMLHHTEQKAATCLYCSYSSNGEAAIQRHMSEFHPSSKIKAENLEAQMAYHRASKAAAMRGMDVQRQLVGSPPIAPSSAVGAIPFQSPEIPYNPFGSTSPPSVAGSMHSGSSSPRRVTPTIYTCSDCGAEFKGRSNLRSHMVTHSDETPWPCMFCDLRYKRKADLGAHMKNKHNSPLPPDIKPEAGSMQAALEENDALVALDNPSKPEWQEQPLNLCVKQEPTTSPNPFHSYSDDVSFEDFEQGPEVKEDQPLDLSKTSPVNVQSQMFYRPDTLKCSHCSYIAKWPSDLRRHKLVHSIERRFHCAACGKKFKYQFDLKTHLRQVHRKAIPKVRSTRFPPRPYQNRSSAGQVRAFATPSGYNSTPQLRCSHCDYVGKYRAELERHMSVHTGQKPWACLFCEYMSHWKGDMKRHLEKHHRQAITTYGDVHHLLNQSYCMVKDEHAPLDTTVFSGYFSAYSTDTESRVPETSKPVTLEPEIKRRIQQDGTHKTIMKCPHCPYENEAPSKVKTHMEIHGNLKRFMCAQCGKRSNWVWDVRKHIRKEHPGGSMDVIQMSIQEARNTLDTYLKQIHGQNSAAAAHFNKHTQLESFVVLKAEVPEANVTKCTPPRRRAPVKPGTPSPAAKLRPFKCSECGRRSNWRWDLNKHIRSRHPHAELITLSEEEARSTIHEVAERQPRCGKLDPNQDNQSYAGDSDCSSPSELSPPNLEPAHAHAQISPTYSHASQISPPSLISPLVGHSPQFPVAQPVPQRQLIRSNSSTHRPGRRAFPEYVKKLVAGKFRPFKCSLCGKRSNWKWDVSKHIRIHHPGQSVYVITLTEEEAKSTYHEVEIARLKLKLSKEEQAVDKLEKKSKGLELSDIHPDLKIIKRFQCSVCLYRSNFKADVTKHIAKQHAHVDDAFVNLLDPDDARDTLIEYQEAHGGSARKSKKKESDFGSPLSGVDLAKALSRASQQQQRSMLNGSSAQQDETLNSSTELSARSSPCPSSICSGSGGKRDIYLCKKCSFYTTSQKAIITHYRSHGEQGIYRCTICNERSDYKHSIVRHVQKRHAFEAYNDADQHIVQREIYTIIHGDPMELSRVAGDNSMDISQEEINNSGFVVTMYKCTICGSDRTSDLRYSVVRHVRRVHPNIGNPEDYVEEYQTTKPALSPAKIYNGGGASEDREGVVKESPLKVRHEVLSDKVQYASYVTKKHGCSMCPFRTNKPAHLKMHAANHSPHPGNKFKCSYCVYFVCQAHHMRAHERLHVKESMFGRSQSDHTTTTKAIDFVLAKNTPSKQIPSSIFSQYSCDRCPFVSEKKNEFLYHKQFHRPKQSAQYKCELCPYWCKDARGLKSHMQVHDNNYLELCRKVPKIDNSCVVNNPIFMVSPCKSNISDTSVDDIIESAELKQRIIASKVKSVAVTPHKVNTEPPHFLASPEVMSSYILNSQNQSVSPGVYRKFYKCRFCPWTNVRHQNLVLHEKMHGPRGGKDRFKCPFCNYYVGNRTLLSHHVKVHAEQYEPGVDIINDVEAEDLSKDADREKNPDDENNDEINGESDDERMSGDEGILEDLDKEETMNRIIHQNSGRIDMLSFPEKSDYYIKYSEGKHILEKAVLKKWCCEKCPYATMKKSQFEKHVSLHGSRQKYVCQYCDYSVPGYHLLLQHEKLHRMPNPNLLSVQSIANLTQLPEIPADVAAATQYAEERSDLGIHDHIKALYEHTSTYAEPKKLYHCDRCPYSNTRRDHILAHLKFHMIRSDYKCQYCDYSVSKSHLLNQHAKVHFILPGSDMSSESPPDKSSAQSHSADNLPIPLIKKQSADNLPIPLIKKQSADNLPIPLIKQSADNLPIHLIKKQSADNLPIALIKKRVDKPSNETIEDKQSDEIDPMDVDTDIEDDNLNSKISHHDMDTEDILGGECSNERSKSINNNKSEENSPESTTKKTTSKLLPTPPGIGSEVAGKTEGARKCGDGPDTLWVCQYCDRVFHSSSKLKQHEQQHLFGSKGLSDAKV